ncbi:MAG: hypothetical protein WCR13_00300 [Sphaerochaeta sp.]
MGKNLRFVLLGMQATITLILTSFFVHGLYLATALDIQQAAIPHFVPSLIHLWVTLIAALLLCVFYRANIGAEARFLPMLFLMISLGNVKVLPLYQSISHVMVLSPYLVGIAYHFSFLFSTFLFLASGLFQQNSNPVKLGQYSFVGAASALFLSKITPISTNSASFLQEASLTDNLFLGVCILINLLAILTFIITIFEENRSRQTVARCFAFILMIAGNTMVTITQESLFNILGLVLYISGTALLILVTRTYHIWS